MSCLNRHAGLPELCKRCTCKCARTPEICLFYLALRDAHSHFPKSDKPAKCILLAEDDPVASNLFILCLLRAPDAAYHFLLADNGQSALEIYEKHVDDIDLVVTNIFLRSPMSSGVALVENLKKLDKNAKIAIWSDCVGRRNCQPIHELIHMGVKHFLEKPISATLHVNISRILAYEDTPARNRSNAYSKKRLMKELG